MVKGLHSRAQSAYVRGANWGVDSANGPAKYLWVAARGTPKAVGRPQHDTLLSLELTSPD